LDNANRLLQAFSVHEHFLRHTTVDAYALIHSNGCIVKVNAFFKSMIQNPNFKPKIKRLTLDDIFEVYDDNRQLRIDGRLQSREPERFGEVTAKLKSKKSGEELLRIYMNSYPLFHAQEYLGVCIVIRDLTGETNAVRKYGRAMRKFEEAYHQTIMDPLLPVYNRRYFFQYVKELTFFSIIMFDLDHFKAINDHYGHQAGDYVLETVTKIIQDNIRRSDAVFRYGGEELIVTLKNTTIEKSERIAEQLREMISRFQYFYQREFISVTTSGGITTFFSGEEIEETIRRADKALYTAKNRGRNRLYIHTGKSIRSVKNMNLLLQTS